MMRRLQVGDTLTAKDVSGFLHIGTRTLYRWVHAGRFPPGTLITRKVRRWTGKDVIDWMRAQGMIQQASDLVIDKS